MAEKLSGVMVVIIIAGGVLTFILLFIFAKRQIMRFALRSRRGPHVPVGHGAKKALKKEIHRRIELVPKIVYEPRVSDESNSKYILPPGSSVPPFYYRLKACDDVKLLEKEICRQDITSAGRHPSESLRAYLLNNLASPLGGPGSRLIHQFCDLYEHARHDPADFADDEYHVYSRILLKLIDAARLLKSFGGSRKTSPLGTPQKNKCQDKFSGGVGGGRIGVVEARRGDMEDLIHDNNETSV
ncbi:protein C1orf43 homolog [Rhodnius prolixus]|uniref:protein C1orf43 homolog n=1 Tax=Rhodnius prolixus TaxID=13249 RepID=UPI003D18F6B0